MEFYNILNQCVLSTSPILDSVPIFLIKVALQVIAPAQLLFHAVRRKNAMERAALSLLPMVFIVTYAFLDIFLGGSFVGGGYGNEVRLLTYILNSNALREFITVLVLFVLTHLLTLRWVKFTPLALLRDLVPWGLFLFSGAVTVDILLHGTITGFGLFSGLSLVTWYVYSMFSLLFQVILNLTALLWHFLFSERIPKKDPDELYLDPQWCKKQTVRLLLRGNRVVLYTMVPLILLIEGILVYNIGREGLGADGIAAILMLHILILPMGYFVVRALRQILFPHTIPAVQRIEQWENSPALLRQFCQEYFNSANPPVNGRFVEVTPHFILSTPILKPGLYYIPYVTHVSWTMRNYQLSFQDGSALLATIQDSKLLESALKSNNLSH